MRHMQIVVKMKVIMSPPGLILKQRRDGCAVRGPQLEKSTSTFRSTSSRTRTGSR